MVSAITLWNTVYLDRAAGHLRERGIDVPDTLLAHVARWAGSISASPPIICGAKSTSLASGSGRCEPRHQSPALSVGSERDSAMPPAWRAPAFEHLHRGHE